MAATYRYEVIREIPEIGAKVWDLLIWRYPDVYLQRKRAGKVTTYTYAPHYVFALLKYQTHLQPIGELTPPVRDLAQQVVGDWPQTPRQKSSRHLRLVK